MAPEKPFMPVNINWQKVHRFARKENERGDILILRY